MAAIRQSTALFTLPLEIRQLIYTHLFRSTVVFVNLKCKDHKNKPWPWLKWWMSSECNIHPNLNAAFTSRRVLAETLPVFFQHALFDLTDCCNDFATHGKPYVPREMLGRMHRLQGNHALLLYLHDVPWIGRSLWPGLDLHALPLEELSLNLRLSSSEIQSTRRDHLSPYLIELHKAIWMDRNFALNVDIVIVGDNRSWSSSRIRVTDSNHIVTTCPPTTQAGWDLMYDLLDLLDLRLDSPYAVRRSSTWRTQSQQQMQMQLRMQI